MLLNQQLVMLIRNFCFFSPEHDFLGEGTSTKKSWLIDKDPDFTAYAKKSNLTW